MVITESMPRSIDELAVDWDEAVRVFKWIRAGDSAYLDAAARYCNNGGFPNGVFALTLLLREDPELDRLLELALHWPVVAMSLPAYLLSRTRARAALHDFARDASVLEARLREAQLRVLDPFLVEGELASYLYRYGMYRHFYDDSTPEQARELARSLLAETTSGVLDALVVFDTRDAWGDWFDEHSCTDRTFLIIDRTLRRATLLVFSHSD